MVFHWRWPWRVFHWHWSSLVPFQLAPGCGGPCQRPFCFFCFGMLYEALDAFLAFFFVRYDAWRTASYMAASSSASSGGGCSSRPVFMLGLLASFQVLDDYGLHWAWPWTCLHLPWHWLGFVWVLLPSFQCLPF